MPSRSKLHFTNSWLYVCKAAPCSDISHEYIKQHKINI